jgi:signal transduction histidine kinase/CheY-like chemotaxis protein
LTISTVTTALTNLQSAPFDADLGVGGSRAKVEAKIAADEALILRSLAPHGQTGASARLLASGRADFAKIEPAITSILGLSLRGGGPAPGRPAPGVQPQMLVPRLQARLTTDFAALAGVLAKISRADAKLANSEELRTKVATVVAILILLVLFGFFYFRSLAARSAFERVTREKVAVLHASAAEARRAAQANAIARDDAVEASNSKSMFVATVSHELRTPLNGVIGMTELLLGTELDTQQREYADVARTAAEGLLLVIGDILDYSKLDAGKIELDERPFSLRETIGEATSILMTAARTKGVVLNVAVDERVPVWLRGDAARLRQVVTNLVSNAVKFTDAGEVTVIATGVPAGELTKLRVEVKDTGIGVAADALARLFEPFTQADNSTARRYGGTGLGLTISARLIESMGGTMGAASEPGKGSSFWFELTLPATDAAEQPSLEPVDHGITCAVSGPDGAPPLILVAEDNPVNQMIASRMLETLGYATDIVADGQAALDAIEQTSYAAVLMDCQMPGLDGYAATRALRRGENGHDHLPVIAMTAHSMDGDRAKCLAAGMDDYISKPMRVSVVAQTLARQTTHSDARAPERTERVSGTGRSSP